MKVRMALLPTLALFIGFCIAGHYLLEKPTMKKPIKSFWINHIPASWGKYKIGTVANEVLLKKMYPDAEHSECGLADDDFIKYAMSKVDRSRQFQFIIFIEGKPLVGERCLRRAFIFYLK